MFHNQDTNTTRRPSSTATRKLLLLSSGEIIFVVVLLVLVFISTIPIYNFLPLISKSITTTTTTTPIITTNDNNNKNEDYVIQQVEEEESHNNNNLTIISNNNNNNFYFQNNETFHNDPNPNESNPKIAWLMSYPNSGTRYTLKLIQQYTNTTTATNYGHEQNTHKPSIPVRLDLKEGGPFPRHLNMNLPSEYILTKTHCAGYVITRSIDYKQTIRSFETACRSGNRYIIDKQTNNNTKRINVQYSMKIPRRVIHLIRNPFDNIVARLHYEQKKWQSRLNDYIKDNNTMTDETLIAGNNFKIKKMIQFIQYFNDTKDGFLYWCNYLDKTSTSLERSKSRFIDYNDDLWDLINELPCHDEFIRYIRWHNFVIEVIRRNKLPVYTLFYEQYSIHWNSTVSNIFNFLKLKPAKNAIPLQFIVGKQYNHYYESQHIIIAKKVLQELASPESWKFIQHYFS